MAQEKQDGKRNGRDLRKTVIKADRMLQVAFMLPAAVLVGWLLGAGLDRWLHQQWIYLAGIFLGIGAGFVQIFRLMHELEQEIDGKQVGKGDPGAEDDTIRKERK